MIQPGEFVRKPFYVSAVQVTTDNLEQVAEWCDGEIRESEAGSGKCIKVHVIGAINARQTEARPNDWILRAGESWKVYTNKAFKKVFEPVKENNQKHEVVLDGDPNSTLPPEAREALKLVAKNIMDVASQS